MGSTGGDSTGAPSVIRDLRLVRRLARVLACVVARGAGDLMANDLAPGFYWYQPMFQPWTMVEVVCEECATPVVYILRMGDEVELALEDCLGIFVGPLEPPKDVP